MRSSIWCFLARVKAACCALAVAASPLWADTFPVARCINLSNALEAPREGDWGPILQRPDIAAIAQAGFDTIRFPIRFSRDGAGAISPQLWDRVDTIVGWAQDDGLNVIVDLHHFFELMDDPDSHGAQFIDLWDQISAHFAGAPDSVIFELLNEPEANLTTDRAEALYRQVLERIRPAHPDRWIVIEGRDWASLEEMRKLSITGDRIVHSFHSYAPFEFTHQGASWTEPPMPAGVPLQPFDPGLDGLADHPVPVLLGEFGVTEFASDADRVAWLSQMRKAAEAQGVGWCVFGLYGPFGLFADGTWLPGVIEGLGLTSKR